MAAQGPLWAPGGDRGLYKTTDGGKTWKAVLTISENTGVTDVVMDPRDPDVLYAAAYQRRRHVWTLIDGGPEGAIHKSTDGGATWKKLTTGLPKEDMGRIGLALAPSKPDTVYAIVESIGKAGGFFRSTDAGGSWEKRSDYVPGSPQYYQEIFVDPDGCRTASTRWTCCSRSPRTAARASSNLGEKDKHVDNHALWIDPANTRPPAGRVATAASTRAGTAAPPGTSSRTCRSRQFYRVSRRQRHAVLQRLRRHPGQLQPGRSVAHQQRARHPQLGLVRHPGRRRLPDRRSIPKTRTSSTPSRSTAAWCAIDRKSGEQIDIQPQPGQGRAGAALELGLAADHQPALAHPALLRRQQALPQRRPRQHLARRQPRPDAADRPQQARGHGQGVERRHGGQEQLDLLLRQHRGPRRIAARGRAALRRHRRRPGPGDRGRRRQLAQDRQVPGRSGEHLRLRRRNLLAPTRTSSTPRSTTTRWATSSPTC